MTGPMLLHVQDLHVSYGDSQVLFGMGLSVRTGEMVSLMGRNGMGKTTTIRSILGLTPPDSGVVVFDGEPLARLPAYRIAQRGIGLVPEGRQVFPNLTVQENLTATAANRHGRRAPWTLASIYALFPALAERRHNLGSQLSGGEQQMLAIGRALMTNPKLLVLDEATEGLAPLVRAEIWRCLARLKADGQALLVVDRDLKALLALADRHVIIEKGRPVWVGTGTDLRAEPAVLERHLGV